MMPRTATVLLASLLWAGLASAHTDDYLDTMQAPHGGQLRMAGAYIWNWYWPRPMSRQRNGPCACM